MSIPMHYIVVATIRNMGETYKYMQNGFFKVFSAFLANKTKTSKETFQLKVEILSGNPWHFFGRTLTSIFSNYIF